MASVMKFQVDMEDGSSSVHVIKPVTQIAFEREYKVGLSALGNDGRMEWLYWLCWHACKIDGVSVPSFDAWSVLVSGVEPVEDDVPLGTTPSPAG